MAKWPANVHSYIEYILMIGYAVNGREVVSQPHIKLVCAECPVRLAEGYTEPEYGDIFVDFLSSCSCF